MGFLAGEHSLQTVQGTGPIGLGDEHGHSPRRAHGGDRGSEVIRPDNRLDPVRLEPGLHDVCLRDGEVGRDGHERHSPQPTHAILSRVDPEITSLSNERVKWLRSLRDRRSRERDQAFLVEGERAYRRALAAGLEPIFTIADFEADWIVGPGALATPAVLDKISYRSTSQGLAAAFPLLETHLTQVRLGDRPLVLLAEGIEKPGNLGAMLRSADAVGADAVVAVGAVSDEHR